MVSKHLYVNYYYLKTFEIKFQSTKFYLTPFKVILRTNHFKLYFYDILSYFENLCDFVKTVFKIKIVKICMLVIVCLFYSLPA